MSSRARRFASVAGRGATRALLVFVAFAFLVATVRGGTRFFFCPMTHRMFDAPPCAPERNVTAESDGPALRISDCCEEKWRASAPTASTSNAETVGVPPAAVVALLSAANFGVASASAKVPFRISPAVRAGPPAPSAGERRASLMVFHL